MAPPARPTCAPSSYFHRRFLKHQVHIAQRTQAADAFDKLLLRFSVAKLDMVREVEALALRGLAQGHQREAPAILAHDGLQRLATARGGRHVEPQQAVEVA